MRPRVIETNEGIQDVFSVKDYDIMMRKMRDRGWLETDAMLKSGITSGQALEVGPGPGYLGLEWLKKSDATHLTAVEISANMIRTAEKNASEYGFTDRTQYILGDAKKLPFDYSVFDAVFTNGSLHEWADAEKIFNEIYRVLKPGGRYWISDLKRNMNFFIKWLMKSITKPKEMASGLISSINAAYTIEEVKEILVKTNLRSSLVASNLMGLEITGCK